MSLGNALVFGASGALGSTIVSDLESQGFQVATAGSTLITRASDAPEHLQLAYDIPPQPELFHTLPELQAVVWAQGINASDSITSFDAATFQRLWQSNVLFIAASLAALLAAGKVVEGSKLCVISSIWQLECRLAKLSYTVSKAALHGLVKSCAIDLGSRGILINAILPGAVETPMTRSQLSSEQIDAIVSQTALGRLADPQDIAAATSFLVGPANRFITGQFLTVDGGFVGFKHT